MKRVVAKAGRAIILEVPEPELRPGEVLVATAFSAISSGTEMHIIHSTANPETLGDDTYPRKPSLQYPAPPQLRSRGVRWSGPEPRGQHTLHLQLFYIASDDRPDEKQMIDQREVVFDIANPF